MSEKELIELFMGHVESMRTHQKDFFKRKMEADKKLSIRKEADVDQFLKLLRRRGYVPAKESKSEQNNLF